jgi:hypothetical protein
VLDKLKAAAMTQPTTMAVPHNPAAVIANRREVITRRLLYRPLVSVREDIESDESVVIQE